MSALHRARRVLVVALTALGLVVPAAHALAAEASTPTTTRVFIAAGEGGTDVVTVRVSSRSGTPKGSVVIFGTGSDVPLGPATPLDATGAATQTVPHGSGISPYRAEFTGTGGYADSVGSANPFGESVKMVGQGTILHVGGPGLLRLTVSFSAKVTYRSDGTPAVGEVVQFTQKNRARGASGHPEMDPNYVYPVDVCTAVVNAKGYATCSGSAAASSITTLLTTPSFANHTVFPGMESVKLPPIGLG